MEYGETAYSTIKVKIVSKTYAKGARVILDVVDNKSNKKHSHNLLH